MLLAAGQLESGVAHLPLASRRRAEVAEDPSECTCGAHEQQREAHQHHAWRGVKRDRMEEPPDRVLQQPDSSDPGGGDAAEHEHTTLSRLNRS
ncbi:MAG: hypothetical protein HOP12_09330 [Candidatus Eisenbacteria bacterium]|uniref:Uncharacterized protein n=1 Tax=Eiseniibacteriota bacterium TaxID=2212470 RepID=A0A849SNE3_UNCEI|nr:hypothetical protein [Candidatus Eisenbacteria bacterium]